MKSRIAETLTVFLMTVAAISCAAEPDLHNYLQSSFDRNVKSLSNDPFVTFIGIYRKNSNDLNRIYSDGIPVAALKKNSKLFKDAGLLPIENKGKIISYPDYASLMIVPGLDKGWKDYLTLQTKLKPRENRTPEQIRNLLISIDGFLKKNPNFPDNDFLKTQYLQLSIAYLLEDDRQVGADNKYKKEYLDSYKKLLKRNSSLSVAPIISEFVKSLEERDYEIDYDFMRGQEKVYTQKISAQLGLGESAERMSTQKAVIEKTQQKDEPTPAAEENETINQSQSLPAINLPVGKNNNDNSESSWTSASDTDRKPKSEEESPQTDSPVADVKKSETKKADSEKDVPSQSGVQALLGRLKKEPHHEFSPLETLQMYGELMHIKRAEFKDFKSWVSLFNNRIKEYGCFVVPEETEQFMWRGGIVRDESQVGKCSSASARISYDKVTNKSICRYACISTKGLDKSDRIINPHIRFSSVRHKGDHAAISAGSIIGNALDDAIGIQALGYKPTTLYFFNSIGFNLSQEELEKQKKQSSRFGTDTYWVSENAKLPVFVKSKFKTNLDEILLTEDFIEQRKAEKVLYEASVALEKQQKEERERLAAEKKNLMEKEQKKVKELAPDYKGDFLGVFTPGETSLALFEEVLKLRGCEYSYGRAIKTRTSESCFKLPHGDVSFRFDKNKIADEAVIGLRGDKAILSYLELLSKKMGRPEKEIDTENPTKIRNLYVWKTPKLAVELEGIYVNPKTVPAYLASEEAIKADARGYLTVYSRTVYEKAKEKELLEKKQQKTNFNELF